MTGRTSRIRKYMLFFQKICNFWKNYEFAEKYFWKKVDFFLAILNFFMAAYDAQHNFMPTKYNLLRSIFVRSKVIAVFFCETFAKVEHTICDCN